MRAGTLGLLAVLLCAGGAEASGQAPALCSGRPVQTQDGGGSDLDDCELARILEQAELRTHMRPCVEEARRASERVFGSFFFEFLLHEGGGLSGLKIRKSVFDRTSLPRCVRRVLLHRLRGAREGRPGVVRGRFSFHQDEHLDFSVSLSGAVLSPEAPPPPPPLPGKLQKDGASRFGSCALGAGQLVLRLGRAPDELSSVRSRRAALSSPLLSGCEKALEAEKQNGWTRREWKKERKKACKCLAGLLKHSDLEIRAAASERLARGRYWLGRRALTSAIHLMLGLSEVGNHVEQARPPVDEATGMALVRMVRAQLRLRRWVRDEVLERLARHPARRVRLNLISHILAGQRGKMPSAVEILIHDSDPIVRARACDVGCQRHHRPSLRVFSDDLRSQAAEVRAAAVLYARSCVRKAERQVRGALEVEKDEAVGLLMLEALPDSSPSLLEQRAVKALFHPCPVLRFLGARLLGRLPDRPEARLQESLTREPNPELKQQLVDLMSAAGGVPLPRHDLRLWLQL